MKCSIDERRCPLGCMPLHSTQRAVAQRYPQPRPHLAQALHELAQALLALRQLAAAGKVHPQVGGDAVLQGRSGTGLRGGCTSCACGGRGYRAVKVVSVP